MQASEGLKLLLGVGEPLRGKLLLFNALDMRFDYVKLKKDSECVVCSLPADEIELIDYEAFCGVPAHDHEEGDMEDRYEIGVQELDNKLQSGSIKLIDVREPHELQISQIEGAKMIPLGEIAGRLSELDTADEFVVFCRSGSRSARAVELMLAAGFRKVKNLRGGINDWARQVDPTIPVY
jgi:adenylyltransferase/sulfurtransferase